MSENHHHDWMIHVNDQENPWIIQVHDQLKEISNTTPPMEELEKNRWEKKSIYKLPESFKNHKKKSSAYTPQVVSLGPYHYKKEHLKAMEEHKDRALLHFLKRSNQPLQEYFRSLALVVEDLKDAYDSLDVHLQRDSDEFLRIMIRDGVFVLEIMRFCVKNNVEGYASNDPIFSEHGKLYVTPLIRRDMLMLENQLPMLVLHKLLAVENGLKQEDQELTYKLVFKFFFPKIRTKPPSNCLHVLDMYRKSLLEPKPDQTATTITTTTTTAPGAIRKGGNDIIRSAVELTQAGITIKRTRNNGKYLTDIKFDNNGILEIPMIVVDDITEPLFLNLIAFEKFHVGAGNEVSGYVFFMDNIIDNAQDIKLLGSKNIIQNCIGSDKDAAELFNSLVVDVIIDQECKFRALCMDINEYCKKRWPRYRANLIETYFRSPWALLSVIAAIFLFALTIQQSVYTALSYHKSNNSNS